MNPVAMNYVTTLKDDSEEGDSEDEDEDESDGEPKVQEVEEDSDDDDDDEDSDGAEAEAAAAAAAEKEKAKKEKAKKRKADEGASAAPPTKKDKKAAAKAEAARQKELDEMAAEEAKMNFAPREFSVRGGLGCSVKITEFKEGTGKVAKHGSTVTVKYRGWLTSSGKQFDKGRIDFRCGAGEVIPGWDLGVKGMKVGSQRRIVIPGTLGYGKRGSPPEIPPNATLSFDLQLLDSK
jgi:FK506-binding nuclear protein